MLRAKFLSSLEKCFLDESIFDKAGRARVIEEVERGCGTVTFERYPTGTGWILDLRKRLFALLNG